MMKGILAIDIDGTVMDFVFPELRDPKPNLKDFIDWAQDYFIIHFYSARFNPEMHGYTEARAEILKIRGWLDHHDIWYDHVTPYKPPAICFIDDRAFGFDAERMPREINWLKIREKMRTMFHEYTRDIDLARSK